MSLSVSCSVPLAVSLTARKPFAAGIFAVPLAVPLSVPLAVPLAVSLTCRRSAAHAHLTLRPCWDGPRVGLGRVGSWAAPGCGSGACRPRTGRLLGGSWGRFGIGGWRRLAMAASRHIGVGGLGAAHARVSAPPPSVFVAAVRVPVWPRRRAPVGSSRPVLASPPVRPMA